MLYRKHILLGLAAGLLALSGCTSDSESGAKTPPAREIARVKVVETVPDKVSRFSNLSATICRDNPLGGLPSRTEAMQLLRTRAYMNGYLTLHSVQVGPVRGALAHNCPGGVQAKGVGFTAAK